MANPVPKIFQWMKGDECSASSAHNSTQLRCCFPLQLRIIVSLRSHKARQAKEHILKINLSQYSKRNTQQESVVILNRLYSTRQSGASGAQMNKSLPALPILHFGRCLYNGLGQYARLKHDMWLVSQCPPFNSVVNSLACFPYLRTNIKTVSCQTLLASSVQIEKTNREMKRE